MTDAPECPACPHCGSKGGWQFFAGFAGGACGSWPHWDCGSWERGDDRYQSDRCRIRQLEQSLAEMTKERDEYRRLYDFRGQVLLRPCRQCGYKPVTVKPAGGIKHG